VTAAAVGAAFQSLEDARVGNAGLMLALRIAFGAAAALRAVLIYGESARMLEMPWAAARAGRAERALRSQRELTRPTLGADSAALP